jgi:hypothetical protein
MMILPPATTLVFKWEWVAPRKDSSQYIQFDSRLHYSQHESEHSKAVFPATVAPCEHILGGAISISYQVT